MRRAVQSGRVKGNFKAQNERRIDEWMNERLTCCCTTHDTESLAEEPFECTFSTLGLLLLSLNDPEGGGLNTSGLDSNTMQDLSLHSPTHFVNFIMCWNDFIPIHE
jgi:hypothetical protein